MLKNNMLRKKICMNIHVPFRLTAFLDYTRMLAYLAMFGYIHQENETPLSTAIAGIKTSTVVFIFTLQSCHNKVDYKQSLSFPRVAICEGRARAAIPSSFLSLICIILTVPRAEDFRNKNRLLVV